MKMSLVYRYSRAQSHASTCIFGRYGLGRGEKIKTNLVVIITSLLSTKYSLRCFIFSRVLT